MFGAPVMVRSVVAAGRTVEGMQVASLHTSFLRPGDLATPVRFEVERIRGGRRFASRRVTAFQGGKPTVTSLVTFHAVSGHIAHQDPMPEIPAPDDLPDWRKQLDESAPVGGRRTRTKASQVFEMRSVGPGPGHREAGGLPWRRTWMRPHEALPDDPLIHAAAQVLASDTALLATVGLFYGATGRSTSLDHSVWWYAPPRIDGWFLYTSESPVAADDRALTLGKMYAPDGKLVLAVAQEGFFAE